MYRIREAMTSGETKVLDADGSNLFLQHQKLMRDGWWGYTSAWTSGHTLGWMGGCQCWGSCGHLQEDPASPSSIAVSLLVLVTHLAEGAGNTTGRGASRALQRRFTHWSCGRLDRLEVDVKHPRFCHVRCQMASSMKLGLYYVSLLLGRDAADLATIESAKCECAAGYVLPCNMYVSHIHVMLWYHPHVPSSDSASFRVCKICCLLLKQEISIMLSRVSSSSCTGILEPKWISVNRFSGSATHDCGCQLCMAPW